MSGPQRDAIVGKGQNSFLNLALVFLIAATTMATSPDGSASGQSEAALEWSDQRQKSTVYIAPIGERLAEFGYEGPLQLELKVEHMPEPTGQAARWRLEGSDGTETPKVLEGTLEFGGDVHNDEDGVRFGDLLATVGPFCAADNDDATPCVPCTLAEGCTLELALDLCSAPRQEELRLWVTIARVGGEPFYNECGPDTDHTRCEALDSWMGSLLLGDTHHLHQLKQLWITCHHDPSRLE